MAMISCPECGKYISDKANTCPNCGYPVNPSNEPSIPEQPKKRRNVGIYIFIGIIVILLIIGVSFYLFRYNSITQTGTTENETREIGGDTDTTNVNEADSAIVMVSRYDINGDLSATGSGFFLYDDQTVVTNYHVWLDSNDVTVQTIDGNIYNVESAIGLSINKDIAILHLAESTGMKPPVYLKKGDIVKCEIEGIGSLVNSVE